MKKSIKRISTLALSTLMAVSAIGGVTASAAETTTAQPELRTIYFVNNKCWPNVHAYLSDTEGDQKVAENAQYPGVELEPIGTTTVIGGEEKNVYKFTVDTDKYDTFTISSVGNGDPKTNEVNLDWTGSNCFYLGAYDVALPHKDFSEKDVKTASANEYYFINNKDWDNVYAYTWEKNGSTVIERKGAFQGTQELEKVGTTYTLDGKPHDVYKVVVNDKDQGIIFNEGFEHGQQSSDISLQYKWGGANSISLDKDNKAEIGHFFDAELKNISAVKPLASDGSQQITVKTNGTEPTVTFVRTGGSVAGATKVEKIADGEFAVTVPEGTFLSIDITVNGSTSNFDVNSNTTEISL